MPESGFWSGRLIAGTEPVISPTVTPDVLAGAGCQHVSLVPTQLRRLLDAGAAPGSVQTVLLGGAAAPDGLLAEARSAGWRVVTTYGMSETCGGCVYDGYPLDGVLVRAGADDRILIGGPVLFSGYRLQPGRTDDALSDGWFRTADLGVVSGDGRVTVRGRADDMINSGGKKVVPRRGRGGARNLRGRGGRCRRGRARCGLGRGRDGVRGGRGPGRSA